MFLTDHGIFIKNRMISFPETEGNIQHYLIKETLMKTIYITTTVSLRTKKF